MAQSAQSVHDFINDWNNPKDGLRRNVMFRSDVVVSGERPTKISVRYSAAKFKSFCLAEKWKDLVSMVQEKSRNLLFVSTDEDFFAHGIIDIDVAAMNHNYSDRNIIGVLRWIGEEFFPPR